MGQNSSIEWCTHTFNPWIGCSKVSEGCRNCYAEALMDKRWGKVKWGPNGTRVKTAPANWREPLRWDAIAAKAGVRHRVFCASLADVFEDRPELEEWRRELFLLIYNCPNLDWLILTKRPEVAEDWIGGFSSEGQAPFDEIFPHVWLGTSVENQKAVDERLPWLFRCRAAVRFLSMEPLLGPVDLHDAFYRPRMGPTDPYKRRQTFGIDWVIAGGETGWGARPMAPAWARAVRDQCTGAGVPFFFKQWGDWGPAVPTWDTERIELAGGMVYHGGRKHTGRELDGRTWDEFPTPAPPPALTKPPFSFGGVHP